MNIACRLSCHVSVAALLVACSSRGPVPNSLNSAQLGYFKEALIEYIDSHPGFFIGRADSKGLRNEKLVILESPEPERRYSLQEFIIVSSEMRFQANYGVRGQEPYCYNGEFTNSARGALHVSAVKLTRYHVRPQPAAPPSGGPPEPSYTMPLRMIRS